MIDAQLNQQQVARVRRMVEQFPKKIRNKILRQELRKAAKTLVAPSKAATPVQTGKLKRSVKVRAVKRSRKAIGVVVGYSDKAYTGQTFYGAFLEWGWKAGRRVSRSKNRTAPDTRTEIPGRRILAGVAERRGPSVLDSAIAEIAKRVEAEARNA